MPVLATRTSINEAMKKVTEVVAFRVTDLPSPARRVCWVRLTRASVSPAETYFESMLRSHLSGAGGV